MPRAQIALSLLSGALLALCGLPTPWSVLSVLPLSLMFWHLSRQAAVRAFTAQTFWAITAYFAVQLFWLIVFMHNLMMEGGLPVWLAWPLAALALTPLYLLEGAFWAVLAYLVARLYTAPLARVWGLAGGWVMLEWTRTLGALAFPWAGLGYTFLNTPMIQAADLGGVLALTALLSASAAALVTFAHDNNPRPAALLAFLWLLGLGYGISRTPAQGPIHSALLLRTDEDSFGKATGESVDAQWQAKLMLSAQRRPDEVLIWSETAVPAEPWLANLPAGLYGVYQAPRNTAVGWSGQAITGQFAKAHPVPLGEYFPLSGWLRPLYDLIFRAIGFGFAPQFPSQAYSPIALSGVLYGVYICYDSIVAQVARQQTRQGAQVLVNVSNDGWYSGWGVWQHFDMGRLRAIENRRYVLRSVNRGVSAVIDDLGQPLQTLTAGAGVLHAEYPLLSHQTVYTRFGDAPALLIAVLLFGYARRWQKNIMPGVGKRIYTSNAFSAFSAFSAKSCPSSAETPRRRKRPHACPARLQLHLWTAGQHLIPVFSHQHQFLNAHPAQLLDIDARLQRDDHPCLQNLTGGGSQARCLVNLKADAVAQRMGKILAQAVSDEGIPRQSIQLGATDTGSDGGQGGVLGFQHGVVDSPQLASRLAQRHAAGHVRVVALHPRPEIQGDELTRRQQRSRSPGMGPRSAFTAGHREGKSWAVCAQPPHQEFQLKGQFGLADARLKTGQQLGVGRVGDGLGAANQRQFARILDQPQPFHQTAHPHQRRDLGPVLLELLQGVKRQVLRLKAYPQAAGQRRGVLQGIRRAGDLHGQTDFCPGLHGIAGIGVKNRLIWQDQQFAVLGRGKAGQVAHI